MFLHNALFRFRSRFAFRNELVSKRFLKTSILTRTQLDNCNLAPVKNEPVLGYMPGSKERCELEQELKTATSTCLDIPIVIGAAEFRTDTVRKQTMPHNYGHSIAQFYYADDKLITKAIGVAVEAQQKWDRVPIEEKLQIWERAADLMAGSYRQKLNAATILGQSKTMIQAEIDSAAELVDFFRFNAHYLKQILKYEPISEDRNRTLNSFRLRGLEGFVAAVSPFNFTAIGGNLAYTPALMGCSVLWKPSDTALLSNWTIFRILQEAGMPPGVVNFVPADGPTFGNTVTCNEHLAGINFTGSVPTFQHLWRQVGQNIAVYRNFPRLIGECGGKNFHFVHPSANLRTVVACTIRSAFEYCGQKCSACSRIYVPESLWCQMKQYLLNDHSKLKVGDPTESSVFMGAVIDKKAFDRITSYIDYAKSQPHLEIVAGGNYDQSFGYFVEPTIVQTTDPNDKLMQEEIFGPLLTVYVYRDDCVDETIRLVNETTPYALTGAIFAEQEGFMKHAFDMLRTSAGNLYLNDKSTGSVVGQQPFGGARLSGTNDKAGGPHYVLRWSSPLTIKETFVAQNDIDYPYMREC